MLIDFATNQFYFLASCISTIYDRYYWFQYWLDCLLFTNLNSSILSMCDLYVHTVWTVRNVTFWLDSTASRTGYKESFKVWVKPNLTLWQSRWYSHSTYPSNLQFLFIFLGPTVKDSPTWHISCSPNYKTTKKKI